MIEVGTRVSVIESPDMGTWAGKSGEVVRKVEKNIDVAPSRFDWVVDLEFKEIVTRVAFSENELELERSSQLRAHAARIGAWWLAASDFLNVAEDDELPLDITEEEMKAIHEMIVGGKVVISID